LFNLLYLWRGFDEPGAGGLLLDAFDAMNGSKRFSFGQDSEAFDDRLLVVLFAVENRPLVSATTFCRSCIASAGTQVSGVYAPIIRALLVPAKETGRRQLITFKCFTRLGRSAGIVNQLKCGRPPN